MRLARHEDQAFGAVARVGLRQGAQQVQRLEVGDSLGHAAYRRGVVGVAGTGRLGQQQVPADQGAETTDRASNPSRVAIARDSGSPATLCSVSSPLPMS